MSLNPEVAKGWTWLPLSVAWFPWGLRVFIANSELYTEVLSLGEYYDLAGICISIDYIFGPRDTWGSSVWTQHHNQPPFEFQKFCRWLHICVHLNQAFRWENGGSHLLSYQFSPHCRSAWTVWSKRAPILPKPQLLWVPTSIFPGLIVWILLSSIFHWPHSLCCFFSFPAAFPLSTKARSSSVDLQLEDRDKAGLMCQWMEVTVGLGNAFP